MSRRVWAGVSASVGLVSVVTVLLSPTLLPAEGVDIVLAGVLPLSFFAAGAVAQLLRPSLIVGFRLLQVGLLHLGAVAGAVLSALLDDVVWVAAVIGAASGLAFALGFVALLDLLVRYPAGHYAWPWVRPGVQVLAVAAVAVVVLSGLGSARVVSVVQLSLPANPAYVPALQPVSGLAASVATLPVIGFLLLIARYLGAAASDRLQMRSPLVTALVLSIGLVTSGLAERALGEDVQTVIFVAGAAALPASFLIGLLRHSDEAERLAAVEASRARIAETASEERRRIERDLHDGAQQQLVALLARIELVRSKVTDTDPRMGRELGEIRDAVHEAHQDLRELAHGIHPATLSDHGLAEAVRSAMARLPEGASLEVSANLERARFPSNLEEAAYLFVLEGTANALKHSGDIQPSVQLELRSHDLVITVSDTGRGVAAADAPGCEMTGLRDRLAAVGGRLEVESSAQHGTRLRGTFPAGSSASR